MLILIALPSIICGYLAYHFINIAFVIISSFMGSYFVVRAFSIWVGHFPNEADIIAELKLGQMPSVNDYTLGYLVFILLIAFVFIKVQWKHKLQLDKDMEYKKYKKMHRNMASVVHNRDYVRQSIKSQGSKSSIKDGPNDGSFSHKKRSSMNSSKNPMIQDYSGTDEEIDMFQKA
jgi:hypothetical protein